MLDGRELETAWWGPGPDQAPTLVLLHEGLGCVELWRDVPERLTGLTGCGVFAYSRFGYGRSDPVPLPRPMNYMHEEALDILPRMLTQAGITRTVLVGHSDGGSIAAICAGATHDPRVLGLVLIAAHFFVEQQNISSIEQIRQTYEQGDLRTRLARYHRDPDVAFYGWNGAWLDPRFRNFDLSNELRQIRVPILALQGADDPYGTDEQLRMLERLVSARLATQLVLGARHSPHLEAKDATLAAISRFVADRLQEQAA
jgi:pimeloyl-ACP methyl ester carboxylesterase